MAGLVPAIHVFDTGKADVDARHARHVYAVCQDKLLRPGMTKR